MRRRGGGGRMECWAVTVGGMMVVCMANVRAV